MIHCLAANNIAPVDAYPAKQGEISREVLDEVVENALRHVHVLRQQSLEELLESLRELPRYLLEGSDHHSAERHLHAILIDGVSAFYWESRMAENKDSYAPLHAGTAAASNSLKELMRLLHGLQASFACMIVATTWSRKQFNQSLSGMPQPSNRKVTLLTSWSTLPMLRIIAQRSFHGTVQLLSRDLKDGEPIASRILTRNGNCLATKFIASLDKGTSVGWDNETLAALVPIRGSLNFSFTITERGIEF